MLVYSAYILFNEYKKTRNGIAIWSVQCFVFASASYTFPIQLWQNPNRVYIFLNWSFTGVQILITVC